MRVPLAARVQIPMPASSGAFSETKVDGAALEKLLVRFSQLVVEQRTIAEIEIILEPVEIGHDILA